MKTDQRKICESGGNQPARSEINPVRSRQAGGRKSVPGAFLQLVRAGMKQARHDQNPKTKQRWNKEHAETSSISAVETKNQCHEQWPDRRAQLIERFIQSKYPSGADRFAGIREHCLHGWFADSSTDPFRHDQPRRERPL